MLFLNSLIKHTVCNEEEDNMQLLIDWLNRNRMCKCEACKTELNVYAYVSDKSLILYCVACNEYFLEQILTHL